MELILGIAGLVFFAKIVLHIYLISRTDEDFDYPREFVTLNPFVALRWSKKLSLPSFENVPEKYRVLKQVSMYFMRLPLLD